MISLGRVRVLLSNACALKRDRRFFVVRQAWRVARKRNQHGCGGLAGDLEVKVLYTPGKGKC